MPNRPLTRFCPRLWKSTFVSILTLTILACAPKTETLSTAPDLPQPTREGIAKVVALPSPYNTGNVSNGRAVFGECAQCHTLLRNGSETNGPNLYGVFQRKAATGGNYAYSEALRNSNIVWDERHLDHWLFNPHEALPGTTMAYIGVRSDSKRRDLLAYLIAVTSNTDQH